MSKSQHSATRKKYNHLYVLASALAYTLTLVVIALLFLMPPNNFDAKSVIMPTVAILFISSLGLGYKLVGVSSGRAMMIAGSVLVAIVLVFVGVFFIAGVAWLTGLYYAQYS